MDIIRFAWFMSSVVLVTLFSYGYTSVWEYRLEPYAFGLIIGICLYPALFSAHSFRKKASKTQKKYDELSKLYESTSGFAKNFLLRRISSLRKPLQGLVGVQDLVREAKPEEVSGLLTISSRCTRQLIRQIEKLQFYLDSEKSQCPETSISVNLERMLSEMVEAAKEQSNVLSANIEIDISKECPKNILVAQDAFKQIIIELLDNSIKALPQGLIKVLVKPSSQKENFLSISIIDEGEGVTQESVLPGGKSLVRAVSPLDPVPSNIGLNLVSNLLRTYAGSISMTNTKEGPFTIEVQFPAKALSSAYQTKDTSVGHLTDLKVLVVEDEPMTQKIISMSLMKAGINADLADNGREAIDMVLKDDYDLVLMDLEMPIMGGLEAAKKITKELVLSKVPVLIAVTSHSSKTVEIKTKESGFHDLMAKPVRAKALHQKLQQLLENGTLKPSPSANSHSLSGSEGEGNTRLPNLKNRGYLFDLSYIEDTASSDTDFCVSMLLELSKQLQTAISEIQVALANEKYDEIYQMSHKLKGEFGIVQCKKGIEICCGIVKASKEHKPQEINLLISDLDKLILDLTGQIQDYLGSKFELHAG